MDLLAEARKIIIAASKGQVLIIYIRTDQEFAYYTFIVEGLTILTFNDAEDSDWIMEVRKKDDTIFRYENKSIVDEQTEDDFCERADDARLGQ